MKNFLQYINEAEQMTVKNFLVSLEKSYKQQFRESHIDASFTKNLGSAIYIKCYLAGDKRQNPNGYWENDMFKITIWIHLPKSVDSESSVLPDSITMEPQNTLYMTKGNKYEKLPFRKTTGDPKKILDTLDKQFKKTRELVKAAWIAGNIDDKYVPLIKHRF